MHLKTCIASFQSAAACSTSVASGTRAHTWYNTPTNTLVPCAGMCVCRLKAPAAIVSLSRPVRPKPAACRTAAKEPSTTAPAAPTATPAPPQQQQQQYAEVQQLTTNAAQEAAAAGPSTRSSSTSSSQAPVQPSPAAADTATSSSTTSRNGAGGGGQGPAIKAPKAPQQWMAPTAAISVSGPYLTTSSIDGDSLIMSAEFLERELVGPYKFRQQQVGGFWGFVG